MNKPKIIQGNCEFCGKPAFDCPHYKGIVDESGNFFDKEKQEINDHAPQPSNDFAQQIGVKPVDLSDLEPIDQKVEIILIRYNLKEVEDEAIEKVKQNTKHPYKLTVFDNYEKNIPLSDLWNKLIEISDYDYVCLLNSDAFVTEGWLTEMMKGFNYEDVAAVGPSGDHVGGIQRKLNTPKKAKDYQDKFGEVDTLSGFCLVLKKELALKYKFPVEVPFYGGEHAWEVIVKRAGYKLLWSMGSFVYHLGEASAKKEGLGNEFRKKSHAQYIKWLAETTPVLFTTYNRLAYTKKSLKSLYNSLTGKIYIIDNGSTDGTQEWLKKLKKDKRLEIILNKKNGGISGAMNQFFEITKNEEYVGKVDNDTIVRSDWLYNLLMIANYRQIDIVQARHSILNPVYDTFEEWTSILKQDEKNSHVFYSKFVGGSGVVVKRNKILKPLDDTKWVLGGWTKLQEDNSHLIKAFCDNVNIELLDMKEDNEPDYKKYPEYYKEVKRASIRVRNTEKTLAEITKRFGTRFAFTRFGDGELLMMKNFKGHPHTQFVSKDFKKELIRSFEIDDDDYLIGNIANFPPEKESRQGFFMPFPNNDELLRITNEYYSDKTFYTPIPFHYAYACQKDLFNFIIKLSQKYKTVFVGGEHLSLMKQKLKTSSFITTPTEQAYDTIDEWYPKVEYAAKRNQLMFISLSMTANVVQKRLWESGIKIGTIDFGSVANAMTNYKGDKHNWIKQIQP
jgi:GT2 family glycosyltransferase